MNRHDIHKLQQLCDAASADMVTVRERKEAWHTAHDLKNTVGDMPDSIKQLWIKIIQTNGEVSDQEIHDVINAVPGVGV